MKRCKIILEDYWMEREQEKLNAMGEMGDAPKPKTKWNIKELL